MFKMSDKTIASVFVSVSLLVSSAWGETRNLLEDRSNWRAAHEEKGGGFEISGDGRRAGGDDRQSEANVFQQLGRQQRAGEDVVVVGHHPGVGLPDKIGQ